MKQSTRFNLYSLLFLVLATIALLRDGEIVVIVGCLIISSVYFGVYNILKKLEQNYDE